MKLYYHPLSQPSRTTLAVSRHLGLELDLEVVDLVAKAQRQPEYLAINPNGKVPCLVLDQGVIWESAAIQEYLVGLAQDEVLLPRDPWAHSLVQRWRFWAETTWNGPLVTLTRQRLFGPKFLGIATDEVVVKEAEENFRKAATILEAALGEGPWITGANLTLADFALASLLTYWEVAGVPLPEFPSLMAWYTRMGELPCWEETTPQLPTGT